MTNLSAYISGRDNNFNLIRFLAATLVLVSHCYPLSGVGNEPFRSILGVSGGELAVDIFFVTSGFLITGSYLSPHNSLKSFVAARILRIYPALIVAIIFTIFVVGALFTNLPLNHYFQHSETFNYFVRNVTLISGVEFDLPGVFANLPYNNVVNGSLWTLTYEVRLYGILAITLFVSAYFSRYSKLLSAKYVISFIAVTSTMTFLISKYLGNETHVFLKLLSLFFVGGAYYLLAKKIELSTRLFSIVVILITCSFIINRKVDFILYFLFLPYTVFYLAYVPKGKMLYFNNLGDYSYGIYVYAFPVQQVVVSLAPDISLVGLFVYAFSLTLVLSILSWYLVEKKALNLKNYFRQSKIAVEKV